MSRANHLDAHFCCNTFFHRRALCLQFSHTFSMGRLPNCSVWTKPPALFQPSGASAAKSTSMHAKQQQIRFSGRPEKQAIMGQTSHQMLAEYETAARKDVKYGIFFLNRTQGGSVSQQHQQETSSSHAVLQEYFILLAAKPTWCFFDQRFLHRFRAAIPHKNIMCALRLSPFCG